MLDKLLETYATLYGKKEPAGMDTNVHKTNHGWREEKVAVAREMPGKAQSIGRDMQPKEDTVNVGHMNLL